MPRFAKLFPPVVLIVLVVNLIYTPARTFETEKRKAPTTTTPPLFTPSPEPPDELLRAAHAALASKFRLDRTLSPLQLGSGELKAYQLFGNTDGLVSIEVHQVDDESRVWVCVPHRGLPGGSGPNPAAYLWYQYARDAVTGNFVPIEHPLLDSTPYPEPNIPRTELYRLHLSQRWSDYESFGFHEFIDPDDDPPHWSPILVDRDGSGRATYQQIHNLMQSPATQGEAIRLLDEAAPSLRSSLSGRVGHNLWPPVTLRGLVRDIQVSSTDLARDHATAYYDGRGDIPTGGFRWKIFEGGSPDESLDRSWPGQDVDMRVIPDADVHYLGSWARYDTDFALNVEIEQFALRPPSAYYPVSGDWVQITGRWVIDCGHGTNVSAIADADSNYARLIPRDFLSGCSSAAEKGLSADFCLEHHTEIHPPELIVANRLNGGRTEAYVTATGAWAGEPLTFAVFPPPRPSLNAVLRYRIRNLGGRENEYDRRDGSELELTPFPTTNPNHLVVRLTSTAGEGLYLMNTGTVLMTARRGLKCVVECWWEEPGLSSVGFLLGTLDDTPARNSRVYYRNTSIAGSNWSLSPIATDTFSRPALFDALTSVGLYNLPAGDYVFRPASPDWDFGGGLAGVVPKSVTLRGGIYHYTFPAVPRTLPASLPTWDFTADTSIFPPDFTGVYYDLTRELLTYGAPSTLGVQGNGLGYPERGSIGIHLQGLAQSESDARAIERPEDAYEDIRRHFPSAPRPYRLRGLPTEGVSRARVAVSLLLHSRGRTVVADRKVYETDERGFVSIAFRTGSHVEDISLFIEVIENPFNPWFHPAAETERAAVYPGATGNDAGPLTLPVLEPAAVATSAAFPSSPKVRAVKLTAEQAELLDEIKEKRSMSSFAFSKLYASKTLPKIPPLKINLVPRQNTKLPGKLENNWLLMKDPIKARRVLGDKLPLQTIKRPKNPR